MDAQNSPSLRRKLGLFETTMGGVGIILGAGIYALIGEVAGKSGDTMWVSFVMAAAMAAIIGLSYAELSSTFPRAGADYEFTRHALGARAAFVVGWLLVIANLVASAAVALGFAGYLTAFWDVGVIPVAVVALVVGSVVAFFGIREVLWAAIILTLVEAGGLLFVIAVGIPHLGDVDLSRSQMGATGVFSGAALVMFAYIGFEQIATLAEETRDATRVMPLAIMASIGVTAALYVMVALAAISVLGWEALSATEAPLADVAAEVLGGRASDFVALVALFSTANTILLMLVAASRMVYGMAATDSLPRFLAWVHPRMHTPARAIVLCLIVSVGFALSGDIGLVAGATNFAIFVGFGAVNLSLIVLRVLQPDIPRPFRVPGSIGRVPILPVIGLAATLFLMANLDRDALLIGAGLFLSGVAAMETFTLWRPEADGR